MVNYNKIYSTFRGVVGLGLMILLIHTSLTTGFDSGTDFNSRTPDTSIKTSSIDSGFKTPGATLYYNWVNYTNNPLGFADQNAAFYDGFTTTVSASSSGSAALNSISPSGVPLPNLVTGINYNFNNLQGKIIEGIEVRILHSTWNGNTGYFANISVELQWNGRSSNTTSGKSDLANDAYSGWNNNFRNVTLGSPTDLWGRSSWSPDDFSNANFGVTIETIDLFSGVSESVDVAWVKVYYSDAPVVIVDPWIQIESIPPTVDIILGTELFVVLNSTVIDPSNLGYMPHNATVFINDSEVLTLTAWENNTLLQFNATPYLETESVYSVTLKFSATNGTHWIYKEVSFLVNVIVNTTSSATTPTSNTTSSSTTNSNVSDTSTTSTVDSITDEVSESSSELTGSTSEDPLALPFNFYFGLIFFLGIAIIRRKK